MMTKLPEAMRAQCPGCGSPTTDIELGRTPDDAGYGLRLEPCGHLVTLELIRDAWGVDIPTPDPTAINHPDTPE
jgi:hypothetical protein